VRLRTVAGLLRRLVTGAKPAAAEAAGAKREVSVEIEVHDELGGVSVYFIDEEDRCLESRFFDPVSDEDEAGPWILKSRRRTSFEGMEPLYDVSDRYFGGRHVQRTVTDARVGLERQVDFEADLERHGARTRKEAEEELFRKDLGEPPREPEGAIAKEEMVLGRVLREAQWREGILEEMRRRRWEGRRARTMKRWILGGPPAADMKYLTRECGEELEPLMAAVLVRMGKKNVPERIAPLLRWLGILA
jgi:hypothetical protein